MTLELGGNIQLTGFRDLDPAALVIVKKIVGNFVKEMNRDGKVVASICHGGWMLVSADIVRGKKMTSFFAIKDDLIAAGATYLDQEVVVDGNLITSRKPDDLSAFVKEIIKLLNRK